jgi:hypothetical protein
MAEDLTKYYKDIQAEINRRKAANPNDPTIADLERFREAKIAVMREAEGAGADPNNIDPGYVLARAQGTAQQYVDRALSNVTPSPATPAAPAATPAKTASNVAAASSPLTDINSMINELKQAQIDANIAALDKAKSRALGAYAGAERSINQIAQSARNINSITSQRGALDFAKYLASRGLVNSGTAAQGELARNVALQGAQSAVEQQRSNQLADVANARANIEAGYQADVAAARAGAESQAMQQAIQEAQRQRELALQQEQFNRQFALQEAGLTGRYGGNLTQAAQQQQWENQFRERQLEETIRQNNIAQSNWQQQFTYQQMRDKIEDMLQKGYLSVQQANVAVALAKLKAEQDPNSLDNKLKQAQLDLNIYTKSNAVLNDAIQRLDSMYLATDPYTGEKRRNQSFTDAQLRAAIIGLNLPDEQTDALLLRYGLPIN